MSLCSTLCSFSEASFTRKTLPLDLTNTDRFQFGFFGACLSHEVANLFFSSAYRFVTCIFCHSHQAGPEVAW